jgi:antitoxin (DNA-binding transcriptional repressor) of toxin-antitoxin stability system
MPSLNCPYKSATCRLRRSSQENCARCELVELVELIPFTPFRAELPDHINKARADKPLAVKRNGRVVALLIGIDRNGKLIISPEMYRFLEKMMDRTISE